MPETKRKKPTGAKSLLPPVAGVLTSGMVPPLAAPLSQWFVESLVENLLGRSQEQSVTPYPFAMDEFQPYPPFSMEGIQPLAPTPTPQSTVPTRGNAQPQKSVSLPSIPGPTGPRFGPTGASQDFGSPVPNVPLQTSISGSDRIVGTLRNNAGTLLPILGLIGLAALAQRGQGKKKPSGRTAQAGSLERGQTLTVPKETNFAQRLLTAAPEAMNAYLQVQEGKKAEAQATAARQQQVALTIAKGMSEGWMTPEMADALGQSAGIPGASKLGGINPLELQRILSRTTTAGAAAMGIELPQTEKMSDEEKRVWALAGNDRLPESVRTAAAAYLASPSDQSLQPLLQALGKAPQRKPTSGGGGGRGGAATANQQMLWATKLGNYLSGPIPQDDPAMKAALQVGRESSAGMTPSQKIKLASDLSRIGYQTTMATGQQFPDITGKAIELTREVAGGAGTSPSSAAAPSGQRSQAEYAAKAQDIRMRGFTRSDIPDLLEKLSTLGFDTKNPAIQAALQSLPEE